MALAMVTGNKDAAFAYAPLMGCVVLIACQQVWLKLLPFVEPTPPPADKKKE